VVTVSVTGPETDAQVTVGDWTAPAALIGEQLTVGGGTSRWLIAQAPAQKAPGHRTDTPAHHWVSGGGGTWEISGARILRLSSDAEELDQITSPMPGTVVAVLNPGGDPVEAGAPVLVVEAMKMEHTLNAPRAGELSVHVRVGDKVAAGQMLARVELRSASSPATATDPAAVIDQVRIDHPEGNLS
jgi:acetyl-CoA/propionyl-CoA carboxylase biotin carboxyl carrier protein